jgi:hypothetical protein
MLSVLSECGVEWKWLGEDLDELISSSEGMSKVFQVRHLVNIKAWRSPINTDYFNKLQYTKDRLQAAKNILASYKELVSGQSYHDRIQVTKIRGEFDI